MLVEMLPCSQLVFAWEKNSDANETFNACRAGNSEYSDQKNIFFIAFRKMEIYSKELTQ
jgi:hypothetical protein